MKLRIPVANSATESAVGAALSSLLGLGLLAGLGSFLGNLSYDLLYAPRPTVVPTEAVMVYMDDDSHRILRQGWFQPWDRSVHARLLERLTACGTRAVVFDILFDVPNTNNAATDERLIRAAKAHGRVLVAGKVDPIVMNGEVIGWRPTPPFDDLRRVTSWGLVEGGGADGVIRSHFPGSDRIHSLAWEAARLTMPAPPADDSATRWLNYYGPPGTIPWVSYVQALDPAAVPDSFFSNKVVFVGPLFSIGFTGGRGTDDFRTPYSLWTQRRSPGVEVNATAYLNLVRSDSLRRAPPAAEALLVLLFGALSGGALPLLRPKAALATGAVAIPAIFCAAYFVTWEWHAWFPWLIPASVQVPLGALWALVTNYSRLQREKAGLQESLRIEKTRPPAPMVQFSVTAPSAVMPRSSFAVDVWAHLENQRQEILKRAREQTGDTEVVRLPDAAARERRATQLWIRLSLFGLELRSQDESMLWHGAISKASFIVEVPDNAALGPKTGLVTVHAEGLKIATLHFSIRVDLQTTATPTLTNEQNPPRKAFASYAHLDRNQVLARVQGMQKVMPDLEVFLDVHSLRSGQDWEETIRKEILASDIFYLFWSENARNSKEVEKEWRFALEQKGRDFIAPVPLVSPELVPPPELLAGMHFNDWTLAFERQKGIPGA